MLVTLTKSNGKKVARHCCVNCGGSVKVNGQTFAGQSKIVGVFSVDSPGYAAQVVAGRADKVDVASHVGLVASRARLGRGGK